MPGVGGTAPSPGGTAPPTGVQLFLPAIFQRGAFVPKGTQYEVPASLGWRLLAVPVDVGVDVLHPTTTFRRLLGSATGGEVPPQYGGLGPGRNALASAPIPNISPSYVAEQQVFVNHDVETAQSGGAHAFDLGNAAMVRAHENLANETSNPGIYALFGGLSAISYAIRAGRGALGVGGGQVPNIGGGAPNPGGVVTPALTSAQQAEEDEIVLALQALEFLPGGGTSTTVVSGNTAVNPPSVAVGGAGVTPDVLARRAQDFNQQITGKGSGGSLSAIPTGDLPPDTLGLPGLTDPADNSPSGVSTGGAAIGVPKGPQIPPLSEQEPATDTAPLAPASTIDFTPRARRGRKRGPALQITGKDP